jgi:Uma2 family endonuclease
MEMSTATRPKAQRLVLYNVDWKTYSRLLRIFAERRSVRLAYDRGVLEIMSPLYEHESDGRFLSRLVLAIIDELKLPVVEGGSMTFRRRRKGRGVEPDSSFWIAHEPQVRTRPRINLRVDPSPDLVIEVDVTSSSVDKLGIYAALGVPEVWRLDARVLSFQVLGADQRYASATQSLAFPFLRPADVSTVLAAKGQGTDATTLVQQFRDQLRQRLASGGTP